MKACSCIILYFYSTFLFTVWLKAFFLLTVVKVGGWGWYTVNVLIDSNYRNGRMEYL